jgi:LacI family transcriptional regulator, galactose operon repressor
VPTISDVARRAGVSPVTVSRVINRAAHVKPTTRAAVERAITELGYVPNVAARSLRSKHTGTLGLLLPDITNPFWTTIARGVEDSAQGRGYAVFLCNTDENPAKQRSYLAVVLSQRVEGVIIAPYDSDARSLAPLPEQNIPAVLVDRRVEGWDTDTVATDSVSGARALVRHLIELGHRRIAVLSGPQATSTAEERVAGYCVALTEAGIPVDARLIRRGEFRAASGEHMASRALDEQPRPDAIFAVNNTLAQGALTALEKRGLRVPEDIALVCFDDFGDTSSFFPFLTIVAQPAYDIGTNAAQLLFSRLDSPVRLPARHIVLPARLIKRHSCGRHLKQTGQPRLHLPMPRDAQMHGILIKPLSAEERQALYERIGVTDLSAPAGAKRPPDYERPDVTRLLKVLQHQEADRVPHLELWITSRSVYEYVLGRELGYPIQTTRPEGQPVTPEDHVEFAAQVGMDAVACNFTWRPNNVFGRASDGSEHYVTGAVRRWADLDNLEPPPSMADQLNTLERYLRAAQGTGVGVFANFTSFFDSAMRAVGVIEALYLFYDDRPFLEALMDALLDHQERVMRAVCDRFAPELAFVMINDEIAHSVGLMIRPDMFEEMFPHRMQRLIAPAKEHGKLTTFHTRGKMDKVLPILHGIGFDVVHPVEPECNILSELKNQWRGQMAFAGGVPLSLLAYGNWEKIEETVKDYCARLAPGGGYVLGSSGAIAEGIPPQNVWAMVQAAHKYGSYEALGSA